MLRRRMQGTIRVDLGRCETCLWGCLRVHGLRNHSFAFIFHPFPYFTEIVLLSDNSSLSCPSLFPAFLTSFHSPLWKCAAPRWSSLLSGLSVLCSCPLADMGDRAKMYHILTECRSASQPTVGGFFPCLQSNISFVLVISSLVVIRSKEPPVKLEVYQIPIQYWTSARLLDLHHVTISGSSTCCRKDTFDAAQNDAEQLVIDKLRLKSQYFGLQCPPWKG